MAAARRTFCPSCHHEVKEGDFLCTECETIVGPLLVCAIPEPPKLPSVVRTLLSPPEATLSRRAPHPPPPPPAGSVDAPAAASSRLALATTKPFAVAGDDRDVPRICAGVDLAAVTLTELDAHLLSLMDGQATVASLRAACGLTAVEMLSVVHSLKDRGLIELVPRPQPKRPWSGGLRPARRQPSPGDAGPPKSASESPLQRAVALEAAGQTARAIRVLEDAIARSSDPAPLYNRLAIALIKERRDYDAAGELLSRAVALEPDNDVYRENLAKVAAMRAAVTGARKAPARKAGP